MNTFFIADPHFGHEAIIRFANRSFESVDEMNRVISDNWNRVVLPEDEIFVLGDFAVGIELDAIKSIIASLNGHKIFVFGNHDRLISFSWWRDESGFQEVSRFPLLLNDFYILSHEPLYMNATMPYLNIFGHVHANDIYRDVSPHGFCVSAERLNYTPISLTEIKERVKNIK
ncbi:MAG: metallophosphoesterase [Planctomycetaceae bacterium]|jgi:calcineurin-like phosphoesterase family protein|nr:metallophosphoesterase [Planctomycetaceae bacterium]